MADLDAATAKMIANLEANTGKPLEQWVATARASGHARHGQIVAWLKADHGLATATPIWWRTRPWRRTRARTPGTT